MSKKGIFSIASGGNKDAAASESNDEVVSPFSTSDQEGLQKSFEDILYLSFYRWNNG